jgi:hypothetical protein
MGVVAVARLNVSVPDELIELAKQRHPSMNVSRVLQEGLRRAVGCEHEHLACVECGDELGLDELRGPILEPFFVEAMRALADLLYDGGTLEGYARVLRRIGREHHVDRAMTFPLPVLSRSQREHRRHVDHQLEATA